MGNAIISVIVPVYNVAPYLHRCLDSVCAQTFEELEIILIDDGSTDGSADICDEFAKKDKRIKVVHQENRGLSAARNRGLELATCDFIGFADSDDFLEPDMYRVLYDNLLMAGADISTCAHDRVLTVEGGDHTVIRNREESIAAVLLEPTVWVYAWNKLYKRELFEGVRYPEGRLYEDSYIILEILERAESMVSTTERKYHYTVRENSISGGTYSTRQEDSVVSAKKNLEFIKSKYPKLISAAKTRYLWSRYVCLHGILQESKKTYADKQKEHCRILRKNLFFITFCWPKVFPGRISAPFYLKVLCPEVYRFLKEKRKTKK